MSFFSTLFGAKKESSDKNVILDRETYADALLGNKVQLVDVRTASEFNAGHIRGALNIDFFRKDDFQKSFERLDKNKPLYIYCRSGARSQKAAKILLGMGFSKIYDLKGGYLRWG